MAKTTVKVSTAQYNELEALLRRSTGTKSGYNGGRNKKTVKHEPGTEKIRGFILGRGPAPYKVGVPQG
jgi:hypothetical protein